MSPERDSAASDIAVPDAQNASAETPPIRIWSMTERGYDPDVSTETLAHAVAGEDEFPRRRL